MKKRAGILSVVLSALLLLGALTVISAFAGDGAAPPPPGGGGNPDPDPGGGAGSSAVGPVGIPQSAGPSAYPAAFARSGGEVLRITSVSLVNGVPIITLAEPGPFWNLLAGWQLRQAGVEEIQKWTYEKEVSFSTYVPPVFLNGREISWAQLRPHDIVSVDGEVQKGIFYITAITILRPSIP